MDTNQGNRPGSGQMRIVQELVAGKKITLAHIIGGPLPIVYQKLGLNPDIDYRTSAIGIMNLTIWRTGSPTVISTGSNIFFHIS